MYNQKLVRTVDDIISIAKQRKLNTQMQGMFFYSNMSPDEMQNEFILDDNTELNFDD